MNPNRRNTRISPLRNIPQRYDTQKFIPECKNEFQKMYQVLSLQTMIYKKRKKRKQKKKRMKKKNEIKKKCNRKANTKIIAYNVLYIQNKYSKLYVYDYGIVILDFCIFCNPPVTGKLSC